MVKQMNTYIKENENSMVMEFFEGSGEIVV
jgi:hypothetical protein